MLLNSEVCPEYVTGTNKTESDDYLIASALRVLNARVKRPRYFTEAKSAGEYFAIHSANLENEVFSIALLDSQNGLIKIEKVSLGTINQATVYPREIVKLALSVNASAVILHHNHPSGNVKPSRADETLTQTLKTALSLVGVEVLDHIITAGGSWFSFADAGMV